MSDIFEYLDGFKWNVLKHDDLMRFSVFIVTMFTLGLWIYQGFDSGIGDYGTSLHWSVFVIYGLNYVMVAGYNAVKNGINGTRSFAYAFSSTVFSVAIFEWYWMINYYLEYSQKWILFDNWYHIIGNTGLTVVGIVLMLHIRYETDWKLRFDQPSWGVALAISLYWCLTGFKQTVYPLFTGELIYVENNWIHAVNLVVKWSMAIATGSLFMFRRKTGENVESIKF